LERASTLLSPSKFTTGSENHLGKPSKVVNQVDADKILPEYDFSRASRNKYASRYAAGSAVVVPDPALVSTETSISRARAPGNVGRK